MIWVPREPPLDILTDVDHDVEPVAARQRDLGVPDGVWWALATGVAFTGLFALLFSLPAIIGERPAMFVAAAWGVAVSVFAKQRWGHRRYHIARALRDAGKIMGAGLALALAWAIVAALAPDVAARLP